MIKYTSDGLEFEEGEIPKCSYCEKTSEDIQLYETYIGGVIVCESNMCRLRLADETCISEIQLSDDEEE